MYKAGKFLLYIGIGFVAVGLIVGFTMMFMDKDDIAKWLIGLVPLGFVLLMAGTVATHLSGKSD